MWWEYFWWLECDDESIQGGWANRFCLRRPFPGNQRPPPSVMGRTPVHIGPDLTHLWR